MDEQSTSSPQKTMPDPHPTQPNPTKPQPTSREFKTATCFDEYCTPCNSFIKVFQEQRPHHDVCLNGSVIGIIAEAASWIKESTMRHFVNIIFGIDTEQVRIVPSGEMMQCGRCGQFYPPTTIANHILSCDPSFHNPEQQKMKLHSDAGFQGQTREDSSSVSNDVLDYVADSLMFVFFNPILLLIAFS